VRYAFTDAQLAWRDEVRAFCRKHVTEALRREMREAGNEGDGPLARAFHKALFDKGWWGVAWPKEYGGLGKNAVEQFIFIEEMEHAGAPGMRLSVTSVAPTIFQAGTDAQKKTWLPKILSGEAEFAVAYSESAAGTDLAALTTKAELVGDEWVITGQKMWNTAAHSATHNFVAVRTEPDAPKHKGISMIIIPMDAPGIEVQPIWTMSNIRTNAVFLDGVRVPKDNLIGERGQGFYYAMMALNYERIAIGSVGLLARLLEELKAFVRKAKRDGKPLGRIPWVRRAVADLEARVEVGRHLGLLNAWLMDQGKVPVKESAMSKVFTTELNTHFATVGMQIMGLAGQLAPTDPAAPLHGRLQWLYGVAPMQRFGGGTNEIQRMIIATMGLGLPRK
jgi:alkylation response protein AidB-like acyl-CoA dehydrogenase